MLYIRYTVLQLLEYQSVARPHLMARKSLIGAEVILKPGGFPGVYGAHDAYAVADIGEGVE